MSVSTAFGREFSWYRRPGRPAVSAAASLRDLKARAASRIVGPATMLGPVAFAGITLALECLDPDCSRITDTISSLAWGQYGWAEAAVFFLFGVTVIALADRLCCLAARGRCLRLGQGLLLVIGLGFIVIAFFPTYHPVGPSGFVSSIHEQTVRVMAILFPLACVFTAVAISTGRASRLLREYTWIAAVLGAVLLPPAAVAVVTDAPWLGAIERLLLANGLIWTEAMAISTFRTSRRDHSLALPETSRPTVSVAPGPFAMKAVTVQNSVSGDTDLP